MYSLESGHHVKSYRSWWLYSVYRANALDDRQPHKLQTWCRPMCCSTCSVPTTISFRGQTSNVKVNSSQRMNAVLKLQGWSHHRQHCAIVKPMQISIWKWTSSSAMAERPCEFGDFKDWVNLRLNFGLKDYVWRQYIWTVRERNGYSTKLTRMRVYYFRCYWPSNLIFVVRCVTYVRNLRRIGSKLRSLSWTISIVNRQTDGHDRQTDIHTSHKWS